MKIMNFTVLYEMDEDGYFVASVPSIPGCYTQGKTLEEAKKRIKEVVKLCLDEDKDYSRVSPAGFIGIDQIAVHA